MPKSNLVKENGSKMIPAPKDLKLEKSLDPLQEKFSNSTDPYQQFPSQNIFRSGPDFSLGNGFTKPHSSLPEPTESTNILSLKSTRIQDVWEDNMDEEIMKLMDLVERYPVIAMDTEFPGVYTNQEKYKDEREAAYQLVRENVNLLKIIQIGISISDENGEVPMGVSTWQFNFKFDLNIEKYNNEAIVLLKNSGINFELLKARGCDQLRFCELFIGSGICLNDNIKWISFHGSFDFAYLLRMLLNCDLPETEDGFFYQLGFYFPNFYDIKYLIRDLPMKNDGLSRLASNLNVQRIGPQHQGGSDALLTLTCWFKLKETHLKKDLSLYEKGLNVLFGLGKSFSDGSEYSWSNKNPNHRVSSTNDFADQMIFYNMGFVNNNMMNPPFFGQNDPFFQTMPTNSYPYNFNMNMGPQSFNFGQNINNELTQMLPIGIKPPKNQKQNFKENKLFTKNT